MVKRFISILATLAASTAVMWFTANPNGAAYCVPEGDSYTVLFVTADSNGKVVPVTDLKEHPGQVKYCRAVNMWPM